MSTLIAGAGIGCVFLGIFYPALFGLIIIGIALVISAFIVEAI